MSSRPKRRVAMDESYKRGPRQQPSAEEDNRPPKRTTVKRTTENWTLSNRRRTTVHWNSTLTMGDTSIGIEGRRTEMTIGSSTTDEVDADRRVGVSSRNDTTEDG